MTLSWTQTARRNIPPRTAPCCLDPLVMLEVLVLEVLMLEVLGSPGQRKALGHADGGDKRYQLRSWCDSCLRGESLPCTARDYRDCSRYYFDRRIGTVGLRPGNRFKASLAETSRAQSTRALVAKTNPAGPT